MAWTYLKRYVGSGHATTEVLHDWPRTHQVTGGSMTIEYDMGNRSNISIYLAVWENGKIVAGPQVYSQTNSAYSGTRTHSFVSAEITAINAAIADGTFAGFRVGGAPFNTYTPMTQHGVTSLTMTGSSPDTLTIYENGIEVPVEREGVFYATNTPTLIATADLQYDSRGSTVRDYATLSSRAALTTASGAATTYAVWCMPRQMHPGYIFSHQIGTTKSGTWNTSANAVGLVNGNIHVSQVDTGIPMHPYEDGEWHLFVLTADAGTQTLWVNGVQVWSGTNTPVALNWMQWGGYDSGAYTQGSSIPYSDTAIFSRVLTPAEIQTMHAEGRTKGYINRYVRPDGVYNAETGLAEPL